MQEQWCVAIIPPKPLANGPIRADVDVKVDALNKLQALFEAGTEVSVLEYQQWRAGADNDGHERADRRP